MAHRKNQDKQTRNRPVDGASHHEGPVYDNRGYRTAVDRSTIKWERRVAKREADARDYSFKDAVDERKQHDQDTKDSRRGKKDEEEVADFKPQYKNANRTEAAEQQAQRVFRQRDPVGEAANFVSNHANLPAIGVTEAARMGLHSREANGYWHDSSRLWSPEYLEPSSKAMSLLCSGLLSENLLTTKFRSFLKNGAEAGEALACPWLILPFTAEWIQSVEEVLQTGYPSPSLLMKIRMVYHTHRGWNFAASSVLAAMRMDLSRVWFHALYNLMLHAPLARIETSFALIAKLDANWDVFCMTSRNTMIAYVDAPDRYMRFEALVEAADQAMGDLCNVGDHKLRYSDLRPVGTSAATKLSCLERRSYPSCHLEEEERASRWRTMWYVFHRKRPENWPALAHKATPEMSYEHLARSGVLTVEGASRQSNFKHPVTGRTQLYAVRKRVAALEPFMVPMLEYLRALSAQSTDLSAAAAAKM